MDKQIGQGYQEPSAVALEERVRMLENRVAPLYDVNCSAWDMQPDGHYVRRRAAAGEVPRGAQQVFIEMPASQ